MKMIETPLLANEELIRTLRTIQNICVAPHWHSERRWRIEELVRKALAKPLATPQTIGDLERRAAADRRVLVRREADRPRPLPSVLESCEAVRGEQEESSLEAQLGGANDDDIPS